jgi:DNA-binding transcriptional LysR family regulator
MKLRELEAFRAILQTNSVTGAAAQLGLTQPQVSRLIASLEDECGFPLFVRRNQRFIPTTEGRTLYIEVERLLRGFEEVKGVAVRIREGQTNHVRIVTSQPLAEGLVSPAMQLMRRRSEHPTFSIEIKPKVEIEARMAQQHFDLGIASLPIHHIDVVVEPFATRDAVVVLPAGHRLAASEFIDLREIAHEPLVVMRRGSYLRTHLDQVFALARVIPNIRVETALSGFACKLVSEGAGIALSDPYVAAAHLHEGLVLKPATPAMTLRYAFVLPSWQPVSAVTRAFMDCIVEVEARIDRVGLRPS